MTATKELNEADLNHVFSVERRGDTLIVAPRGDATSFPEHHFFSAVAALRRRFDGTRPGRLIVDLSQTNYPGTAMLDVFDDLIVAMHWRGETAVVAGANNDVRRVLQEYGLGGTWTHYDDLDAAAAAVVHEPVWRRTLRHPSRIAAVAAVLVLLLAGGFWWTSRSHPDRVAFEELMEIWTSFQAAQQQVAEVPDLVRTTQPLVKRVDAVVHSLDDRGARQELFEPAKHLQAMLHQPRLDDDIEDRRMQQLMMIARDRVERDGY